MSKLTASAMATAGFRHHALKYGMSLATALATVVAITVAAILDMTWAQASAGWAPSLILEQFVHVTYSGSASNTLEPA